MINPKKRYDPIFSILEIIFTMLSPNQIVKKFIVPMEKEEVAALSFDFIGGNDVMPIGGFYGPHNYNFCWDGNCATRVIAFYFYHIIRGT